MNKESDIPTTKVFDADEFAPALRKRTLCLSFERLSLCGPDGGFEAQGVLVSRGEKLFLECSPIKDASVPKPIKSGYSITYDRSDFWSAKGTTLHGVNIAFSSISPPFWHVTTHMRQNGSYECYKLKIREMELYEEPVSEEAKARLQEWFREIRTKFGSASDTSPSREPKATDARIRACIPNTKLKLHNCGVKTTKDHPFFEYPAESHVSDCFKGELENWEFCFVQGGEDVVLHLRTKEGFSSLSSESDLNTMNGLLAAFAFMHGIVSTPWHVAHRRGDGFKNDKFIADFYVEEPGPTPIGGPKTHEFGDGKGLAHKMMVILANHFCSASETAKVLMSFHWQHVQAAQGSSIRLYHCLHVCAILEGMTNQLLIKKFGWTEQQVDNATAATRIKSVVQGYKIQWDGGFDSIYSEWKRLRNTLAHGEFFGPTGAWEKDLFSLTRQVSGGIMTLILADAGWDEPIDFRTLNMTSHLYY